MIESFQNEYRWLSNFAPSEVYWLGRYWPTVEHAYQATKASSEEEIAKVAAAKTPGRAKRAARKFNLAANWEARKVDTMRQLLEQKFSQPEYKAKLLETGTQHIQEGNTWDDTFWGVCKGEGRNILGRLIMDIRARLRLKNELGPTDAEYYGLV